ncbi:MAG: hypothetical protein ACQETQ_09130 [Spirochaetota bacterium]
MKVSKKSLVSMSMPYAISNVRAEGEDHIIAATEDYGPLVTFSPPEWEAVQIMPGPGGCMSLIQRPDVSNQVMAIMQCFPGYKFHDAGVYVLEGSLGSGDWTHTRIMDLPFAHRLEVVRRAGKQWLIAASLAETKDSPEDWSKPGAVYAGVLEGPLKEKLPMKEVLTGLHKNHGLLVSSLGEKRILMITGEEGLFISDLDDDSSEWKWDHMIDHEISEVFLRDLDGDGVDELVTIEPLHGNKLRVYRMNGSTWEPIVELPVDFGHGLWVGELRGQHAILVGNRRGSRDLDLYTVESTDPFQLRKHVIDEAVGPANIAVLPGAEVDRIFTTNQETSEVALYTLSEI